jgi:hypothetical protein
MPSCAIRRQRCSGVVINRGERVAPARITFAAYSEAFERVLGLPPGSFPIIDTPTMRLWFG